MHREIRQEQDIDTTLDQDVVAPAPYDMPIEVGSVRVRAPASGENAFWSRVLDCGRETEVSRWITFVNWRAIMNAPERIGMRTVEI